MPSISDDPVHLEQPEMLLSRRGLLAHISLNRPKALNSLTLAMVREIATVLDDFERDPGVTAVLISGEGERGFCAGGDIRSLYDNRQSGPELPTNFWREEYRLNARISNLSKPYIVFMDGIVMGGGAGLAVHGSHRIVTERTRFAMPEVGIGFFPDVGASWFLTRQPGECGTYLALTGAMIGAGDAIMLGLADNYVPSAKLEILSDRLAALPARSNKAEVSDVVASVAETPPDGAIWPQRDLIDRLFAFHRIEDILAALDREGSGFAAKTTDILKTKSPLSLHVTLRMLRLGRRSARLEECLEREFAATGAVLRNNDFYEGIRAAIVDKDRNPEWQPSSMSDVTEEQIAAYFPAEHSGLFEI